MPEQPTAPQQPRIDIQMIADLADKIAALTRELAEQRATAPQKGTLSLIFSALPKVLPMLGIQGGLVGVIGTLLSIAQGMAGPVTSSPTTGTLLTGFGGALLSGLFAKLFGKR